MGGGVNKKRKALKTDSDLRPRGSVATVNLKRERGHNQIKEVCFSSKPLLHNVAVVLKRGHCSFDQKAHRPIRLKSQMDLGACSPNSCSEKMGRKMFQAASKSPGM